MSKNKKIGDYIKLNTLAKESGISYYKLTQFDKGVDDALTKEELNALIKLLENDFKIIIKSLKK